MRRTRAGVRHPRAAGSLTVLWAALAACSPLPFDVAIGTPSAERPKVVAVALDGEAQQVAVLDSADVDPAMLPTIPQVADGQTVEVVVLTLEGALPSFNLAPGLYEQSSGLSSDPTVGQHSTRAATVEGTTIVDGEAPPLAPVTLPTWLAAFRLPATQSCLNLSATPLDDLRSLATFVVPLSDGRALVGTRDNATVGSLFLVTPDAPNARTTVLLEKPPEISDTQFFALGALPLSDRPTEAWLVMRFGEVWRVSLRDDGVAVAPSVRVPLGITSGLSFVHGRATVDAVELYGLSPEGPLVRFDGRQAETLYTFPGGSYFAGGISADSDGVLFAGRSSQSEIVEIRGDRVSVRDIDGVSGGITAVALIPGVGLVAADGRGRAFVRQDDLFSELVDLEIGTGAQALISTGAGFLAAGGAGATREWRLSGGLCAAPTPSVSQTLRFWAPLGDGWLVSGPERDGSSNFETPLTLFSRPR